MTREVTEQDLRRPELREGSPQDYEFRDDGQIVRKDRFRKAMFDIASALGYDMREGFETELAVASVELLIERARADGIEIPALTELPK